MMPSRKYLGVGTQYFDEVQLLVPLFAQLFVTDTFRFMVGPNRAKKIKGAHNDCKFEGSE